jgi:hypothetical protein
MASAITFSPLVHVFVPPHRQPARFSPFVNLGDFELVLLSGLAVWARAFLDPQSYRIAAKYMTSRADCSVGK